MLTEFLKSAWLAGRELYFERKQLQVVVLTIALGFIGPSFCLLLKDSLESFVAQQSRSMLGADLVLTSTRELTKEEVDLFKRQLAPLKFSEDVVVVTMARSVKEQAASGLVEVQAVDAQYPLLEPWQLRDQKDSSSGSSAVTGADLSISLPADMKTKEPVRISDQVLPIAFVSAEVLPILKVQVGEVLQLGHAQFRIQGVLKTSGGNYRPSLSFAPKVFISKKEFAATDLAKFGSQLSFRASFLFSNPKLAATSTAEIKRILITPDIFVRTPDDAVRGLERFSQFFLRYLGLLSLIVLVLALTTSFYLLQSWQQARMKPMAIRISLGASAWLCSVGLLLQALTIGLLSVTISLLVTGFAAQLLQPWLQSAISQQLNLHLSFNSVLLLFGLSALSSLGFVLPTIWRINKSNLLKLLAEGDAFQGTEISLPARLLLLSPLWLVGTLTSYFLLSEWLWAVSFLFGFAAFLVALWFMTKVILQSVFRVVKNKSGALRLILVSLVRSRLGMDLAILALALSVFVMNLLPPLLNSVRHELAGSSRQDRPLFFLFNVQKVDLDRLGPWLAERNYQLKYPSPLIQARLEGRNGKPFQDDVLQKFPVRVTTRDHLAPSESIVAGEFFKGPQPDIERQEVSLEQQFAKRNSIQLGDILDFEIQGVQLKAKVTSLRRVRWTDFHPNFFIQFPSGFLDDLPSTYIASVMPKAMPSLQADATGKLQAELIQDFPDVSLIDVAQTLNQVVDLIESFREPLMILTWSSGILSLLLAQLILLHNLRARQFEFDLEKLLGASPNYLRKVKWAEYAVLVTVASFVGLLASEAIVRLLLSQVLQIEAVTGFLTPVLVLLVVFGASLSLVWINLGSWLKRQAGKMNG